METILNFVQSHKPYFDAAHALSSIVSLTGWCLGAIIVAVAWHRNAVRRLSIGPFAFEVAEAVQATAAAKRAWPDSTQRVDIPQIRATVERAFRPEVANNLIGKAIIWADDNPENNELAVRAFRKFGLDVEQVTSTEAALESMARRRFDLVISDMGRGEDMRAGYALLKAIREQENEIPFLIFAGSDRPEFRREAKALGAQLSTNDLLELIDTAIDYLGSRS